jgi:HTH-type transcriptional regulator/antitoxin HigA
LHPCQTLPFKVIKSKKQYFEYFNQLEQLVVIKTKTKDENDTIELLTLLIEKWDEEQNTFTDAAL